MKNPNHSLLAGLAFVAIFFLLFACTGCTSLSSQLERALPEGSAKHVSATITGKFSATTIEADNFSKTPERVTAEKLHFRHSNAWVPLIEGEISGYERNRLAAPAK